MKRLRILLLFLFAPWLMVNGSWLMVNGSWSAARAQVTNYQNWMAFLEDDAFVCQLSIPGAHDACASSFTGWSAIGAAVAGKVQTLSVKDMLPLGVRLFDLRPNNQLNIHHGILQTSSTLDGVMGQLRDYVASHPSEFCVVLIRHESEGDSGSDSFADRMQQCLQGFGDCLVDFRPNLTVGEARGKILFLSRDEYSGPVRGGRVTDWRDNQSDISGMLGARCQGPGSWRCPLWSQGYYEYSGVDAKKKVVEAMLGKSCGLGGGYSYTWVINGLDGYSASGSYTNSATQTNAGAVNPYMQELLASGNYNGPAGLVFMDYCCDDSYSGLSLTREIINHNFRYTMSRQGDAIRDGSGSLFVAPRGCDMMWEGRFCRGEGTGASGPSGWFGVGFDDSAWETMRFPAASAGTDAPYYTQWDGTNNSIWVRREFFIDHDPTYDRYKLYVRYDDAYTVYLNGTKIGTGSSYVTDYKTVNISSSRLNVGRNVLAIQVQQKSGGAYFDCGILRTEATKASLKLTSDRWHDFVALGHDFDFGASDVKAYKVTDLVDGEFPYVKTEEVSIVPSGEAVIVRSDKGAGTYSIPAGEATAATWSDNLLKATTAALSVTGENTIYSIGEQDGNSCFYPVAAGTSLAKGKAYLDMSSAGINPDCIYIDGVDPDRVPDVRCTMYDVRCTMYDLSGRQIVNGGWLNGKLQRGLYIIGGKRVLVGLPGGLSY